MISKQIEIARFSQGLTKGQLCEKANMSRSTYDRFLKGEDITLSTLEKILNVIGFEFFIKEK